MSKVKKKTASEIICQNLGLPNQTIFQDYKCVFKVNFPFFGRLYIGEEHLMFVSNMFGIVKKSAIEIQTISRITEISVDTISVIGYDVKNQRKEEEEYIFSGFKNNNAYKIIYALWKKETLSSEVLTSQNQDQMEQSEKNNNEMKVLDQANVEINFFNPQIVDAEKQKIIEIVLPCSLEQFYNFFVGDEAIYSRKKHLEGKKATNMVCTPWKKNEEMNAEMRQLSGTLKVKGVPFRSEANMSQVWLLTKRTEQEINIKVITQMADIPYSSHFTCEEHIVVLKETDTKCRFSCSTAVVFNKSTMMKVTILTRTFADYKEDYMIWSQNVRELLDNMRKSHDESQKKKSRSPSSSDFQFQELKLNSPIKSSKSLKYIETEEDLGLLMEKKMSSINLKINLLIGLVFVLIVANLLLVFYKSGGDQKTPEHL